MSYGNSLATRTLQDPITIEDAKVKAFLEEVTRTISNGYLNHEEAEKEAPRVRQKVLRADQRYNKAKRKTEYLKSATATKRMHRFSKCVILVRTIISSQGVPAEKVFDIKGTLLQKALNEINKDIDGFTMDPAEPEIDPYVLFFSKDRLAQMLNVERAADTPNSDLLFELEAAVEFINEEYAGPIASFHTLSQESTITFKLLWMLFRHKSLVVSRDEFHQYWAGVVKKFEYVTDPYTKEQSLRVWYNYVDHNGYELGICNAHFDIKEFTDKMTLQSLSHRPLASHPEASAVRTALLSQGRKALLFHGRRLIEYRGSALQKVQPTDQYDSSWYRRGRPEHKTSQFNNHGRVMLDPKTWQETKPGEGVVPESVQFIKDGRLSEEQTMIITPKLYGFSLGNKIWGTFACSRIEEVKWDAGVLDTLVLDQERKDLIRDLVEAHALNDFTFDDFIRFKGKGLVGLLTGPPGVGKTMTAEAIAEVAKRPLYVIGSGELGDRVETIHETLKRIMELAELWDAVVLLDEADTFLCHRSDSNLTQNAVASIFLRELEYYQGILILTTNRLTSIDSAFQSRIHFNIQYPDLDYNGRENIWRRYLERAGNSKRCAVDVDRQGYQTLAAMELNGREIKNIMSISQAIATRRGKPITVASIRSTVKICQDGMESRLYRKNNADIFDVL